MGGALLELDVSRPLRLVELDGLPESLALQLRDGRRPLGSVVLEQPGGRLEPDVLLRRLFVLAGVAGLVEERLRHGLSGTCDRRPAPSCATSGAP